MKLIRSKVIELVNTADDWTNNEVCRQQALRLAECVADLERALVDVLRAFDHSGVKDPDLEERVMDGWVAIRAADVRKDRYDRGQMADRYDTLRSSEDAALRGSWRPKVDAQRKD